MAGKELTTILKLEGKLGKSVDAMFKKLDIMSGNASKNLIGGFSSAAKAIGAATVAAGATMGVIAGEVTSQYAEFEQALANTAAIAGATGADFERLKTAARDAGETTATSAKEAAEALGYMALAGWDVAESEASLMPMIKLREAMQSDMAETSDLVTDSMNALGIEVQDMTGYLDVLAITNNRSNTSALQLMEAFTRAGGAIRNAKMSTEDAATALGILADNGIKAEMAGTALNSMLVRMQANKTALKAMSAYNISMFDDLGNARDFEDVLLDIKNTAAGMTDKQRTQWFADIAGIRRNKELSYLLAAVGEGNSRWKELNAEIKNSEGALDRMYSTATNTMTKAMEQLKNSIQGVGFSLFEAFSPSIISYMIDAKEWINRISEAIKGLGEFSLDGLFQPFRTFADIGLRSIYNMLSGKDLKTSVSLAFDANSMKVPPEIYQLIDFFGRISEKAGRFFAFMKKEGADAFNTFRNLIHNHIPIFEQFLSTIESVGTLLARIAKSIVSDLKNPNTTLHKTAVLLLSLADSALAMIDSFARWDGAVDAVKALVVALISLRGTISIIKNVALAINAIKVANLVGVSGAFKFIALSAISACSAISNWVGLTLLPAIGSIAPFIGKAGLMIAAAFAGWNIGQKLYELISGEEITMSFREQMATIFGSFTDGTFLNAYIMWSKDILEGIKGTFIALGGLIGELLAPAIEKMKMLFAGIQVWLETTFMPAWDIIWTSVKTAFNNVWNGFTGTVKTVINGILSVLNSGITNINNAISGIANSNVGQLGAKVTKIDFSKARIPTIPLLAQGATIASPTLAMIGEGRDAETVVPHNSSARSKALLAEATRGVYGNTASNNKSVYNISFAPVINGGGDNVKAQIMEAFAEFKAELERMKQAEMREVYG